MGDFERTNLTQIALFGNPLWICEYGEFMECLDFIES